MIAQAPSKEKQSFLAGIRFCERTLKHDWKKLKDEEHLALLTFKNTCQTYVNREVRGGR